MILLNYLKFNYNLNHFNKLYLCFKKIETNFTHNFMMINIKNYLISPFENF